MSLNTTPNADRLHIALFGKRNAGKSSLLNAITGQQMAIVSDTPGTTTDPVQKAMELLPIGPVVLIDTAGLDDDGALGELRVQKTRQVLRQTDVALLVTAGGTLDGDEAALLCELQKRQVPTVLVHNKADLSTARDGDGVWVSALTGDGIDALKQAIIAAAPKDAVPRPVAKYLTAGETIVLVVPIDESAPKGRLILPQQQVLRDALDCGCIAVVTQPDTLAATLENLKTPPRMVITDSQAFGTVADIVPEDVPLTSFSILLAQAKTTDFAAIAAGALVVDDIHDGDRILISEGCTHHRQCGDIGTVKLPMWIRKHTGAQPEFTFTSGTEFPADLSGYRLIVHCGGCMLGARELRYRYGAAKEAGVPMTNYGVLIAHLHGILRRSIAGLGD